MHIDQHMDLIQWYPAINDTFIGQLMVWICDDINNNNFNNNKRIMLLERQLSVTTTRI